MNLAIEAHTSRACANCSMHPCQVELVVLWTFPGNHLVSFHVQVPGAWSVQRGHDLLETMEEEIRRLLPAVSVFTHLEPVEDPVSYHDTELDRPA